MSRRILQATGMLAITLHIALSILVMRAVVEERLIWLVAAMLILFVANMIAVAVLRAAGPLASELALTVVVVLLIALIIRPAPRVPSLQPQLS